MRAIDNIIGVIFDEFGIENRINKVLRIVPYVERGRMVGTHSASDKRRAVAIVGPSLLIAPNLGVPSGSSRALEIDFTIENGHFAKIGKSRPVEVIFSAA